MGLAYSPRAPKRSQFSCDAAGLLAADLVWLNRMEIPKRARVTFNLLAGRRPASMARAYSLDLRERGVAALAGQSWRSVTFMGQRLEPGEVVAAPSEGRLRRKAARCLETPTCRQVSRRRGHLQARNRETLQETSGESHRDRSRRRQIPTMARRVLGGADSEAVSQAAL
jgi:hypothetical protein